MKQLITTTACAAVLLMSAQAAWAGAFHYRAASGDIPSGSGCQRVSNQVPAAAPYTAMRCPSTVQSIGQAFVINTTYPTDATSPGLTPRIHYLNPDSGIGGQYCLEVCMEVVKGGQSRNAATFTNCTSINSPFAGAQNIEADTASVLGSIVPTDTANTPCTTSACSGAELIIYILRATDAIGCSNNAALNIDFQGISLLYQ